MRFIYLYTKEDDRIVTDGSGCVVDLYVSRFDARHEDSVAVHKLAKGVSDGITGPPNPDGLHHARVAKLTNTQLSVKYLKKKNTGKTP